ncbi:MAG: hypothetical protein ACLFO5_04220, partial [Opitutales bacterium]
SVSISGCTNLFRVIGSRGSTIAGEESGSRMFFVGTGFMPGFGTTGDDSDDFLMSTRKAGLTKCFDQ